jgi:hypothetical protein
VCVCLWKLVNSDVFVECPFFVDFEHTHETLATVSSLCAGKTEEGATQIVTPMKEDRPVAPKNWNSEQLLQWLVDKRLLGHSPSIPTPLALDGRQVMRMSKIQLRNSFYDDTEWQKADLLFNMLRGEADRVARLDLKRRIASKSFTPTT